METEPVCSLAEDKSASGAANTNQLMSIAPNARENPWSCAYAGRWANGVNKPNDITRDVAYSSQKVRVCSACPTVASSRALAGGAASSVWCLDCLDDGVPLAPANVLGRDAPIWEQTAALR